jgi:hypothetical protein
MTTDLSTSSSLAPPPVWAAAVAEAERYGWRATAHPGMGDRAFFQTFQGGHWAPCRALANEHGQRLLAIGLEAVQLPGDEALFPRFLAMSMEERMALALTRAIGGFDWLLLATGGRIDLWGVAIEASKCRVAGREDFEGALLPILASMARGRVGEAGVGAGVGRVGQGLGAESLGGWVRHWGSQLAAAVEEEATDRAERVLWKWIVMLQAARRRPGGEAVAGGWGLRCMADPNGCWKIDYDAVSATEDLRRALETFDRAFPTRHLEPEDKGFLDRLGRLDEAEMLDRLRAELLMHDQGRLEPETVAWLFTDLAAEQEGWRREARGLEPIHKRVRMDGWTVLSPLWADVATHGLTSALADADRLAEHIHGLSLYEARRRAMTPREATPTGQIDLFCPNPRGVGPDGLLQDGLNYLYGEALRLRGVEPARRTGVAVTLLLKALALAQRWDWPAERLDALDLLLPSGDRPRKP